MEQGVGAGDDRAEGAEWDVGDGSQAAVGLLLRPGPTVCMPHGAERAGCPVKAPLDEAAWSSVCQQAYADDSVRLDQTARVALSPCSRFLAATTYGAERGRGT